MRGWPAFRCSAQPAGLGDVLAPAGGRDGFWREGGGAREDRLRHRWRLLEIAEKTGRSVEEVRIRLGLGDAC